MSEERGQISDRAKEARAGITEAGEKTGAPRFSPIAYMLTKNLLGPDTPELRAFFWVKMYQAESDTMPASDTRKATAELSGGNTQRVGSGRHSSTTGEQS